MEGRKRSEQTVEERAERGARSTWKSLRLRNKKMDGMSHGCEVIHRSSSLMLEVFAGNQSQSSTLSLGNSCLRLLKGRHQMSLLNYLNPSLCFFSLLVFVSRCLRLHACVCPYGQNTGLLQSLMWLLHL